MIPLVGKNRVLVVIILIVFAMFSSNCVAPASTGADPVYLEPELEAVTDEPEADYGYIAVVYQPEADVFGCVEDEADDEDVLDEPEEIYVEPEPPCTLVTITISAAGDTTLGGDPRFSQQFLREFERQERDHGFFLREVRHIFEADDLTILNLEGALTEATEHVDKTFVFRGPPHFAKILSSSGVEAVSMANNHTIDFFERGYQDTIDALDAEGVAHFGNGLNTILEINGIRVGLFGYRIWHDTRDNRNRITRAIEDLQERGAQLIIAYYHWGVEGANMPSAYQVSIGRFTIDSGADLVLGAHAHVLQGIEVYNGKNIVYSLANFSFGGNNNPRDHDTMIFQQTFTFDDGVLLDTNDTNIIPTRISTERGRNNFQPMVAEDEAAERILQRIEMYSEWLLEE